MSEKSLSPIRPGHAFRLNKRAAARPTHFNAPAVTTDELASSAVEAPAGLTKPALYTHRPEAGRPPAPPSLKSAQASSPDAQSCARRQCAPRCRPYSNGTHQPTPNFSPTAPKKRLTRARNIFSPATQKTRLTTVRTKIALSILGVLSVCACSSTEAPPADPPTTTPPVVSGIPVSIGLNQAFILRPDDEGGIAAGAVGMLSFSRSPIDRMILFSLIGSGAEMFAINSDGQIKLNSPINAQVLPISITVQARLAQSAAPSASASLNFYVPGTTTSPSGPAAGVEASVNFTANQAFMVVVDNPAGAVFGQVAYTSQGLFGSPLFVLAGPDADSFVIDAGARLSVAQGAVLSADTEISLNVEAYGDTTRTQRLATTPVTVSITPVAPAIDITPPADVRLALPVAANAPVSTVTARLLNPPAGSTGTLRYSLGGGNSQNLFAIDAAGRLTTAQALPSRAQIFILRIDVHDSDSLDLLETTELTITVAEPGTLTFTQPVYTLNSSQFALSETSTTGQCLISFTAPPAGADCAVNVYAFGTEPTTAISYNVTTFESADLILGNSTLSLRRGPDYQEGGLLIFHVVATAGTATASADVIFEMLAPQVSFAESAYTFTDVARAPGGATVIGRVQAQTEYSAVRNAPLYRIVAGDSDDRFSIDPASGDIRYIATTPAAVGERVALTVLAVRTGAQSEVPVSIQFAPQITFTGAPYSAAVDTMTNFPDHRLVDVMLATTPADLNVSFRTAGANADKFRVDASGAVYLLSSLSADTVVSIEAYSNQTVASADLTVTVTDPDFLARPIDSAETGGRLVYFTAVVPSTLNDPTYTWDFGDSSAGTGAETAHLYATAGTYTVVLTITLPDTTTRTITHNVAPFDSADPLVSLQWYLSQPTPSPFFSTLNENLRIVSFTDSLNRPLAIAGEDIRAPDPLRICGVRGLCRGEGVVVRIVDGGVQLDHPDLLANTVAELSWDTVMLPRGLGENPYRDPGASIGEFGLSGQNFSALVESNRLLSHATAVAGIIGARDGNGRGGRGIAPRATLTNYNSIFAADDDAVVQAFQITQTEPARVFNHSWSFAEGNAYFQIAGIVVDAYTQTLTANDGLGAVHIKATGNAGNVYGISNPSLASFGNRHAAALSGLNDFHGAIVVAGVLSNGQASPISEVGDNVVIAAYDGPAECTNSVEYRLETGYANPLGIVTTDLSGSRGSTWRPPVPLVEISADSDPVTYSLYDYPDDIADYNLCFKGTSAVAPQVTGAAALLIQARPDLSWRDVRAILIETARRNAPDNPDWVSNADGRPYNPAFGFGVLDAARALALARSWRLLDEEQTYTSAELSPDSVIADCAGAGCDSETPTSVGVSTSFLHNPTSASSIDSIETVQVKLRLEFSFPGSSASAVPTRATIEIALEHLDDGGRVLSRSLLHKLHPAYKNFSATTDQESGFPQTTAIDWTYLSVRHFGESADGQWRLVITDHEDDNAHVVLKNWQLILRGH